MKSTKVLRLVSISSVALSFLLGAEVAAFSRDNSENTPRILDHLDLVPSWQRFTFAEAADQAGDDAESRPGGERIKTKSPLAAFLLGGILGFGSG